jgi:hypothetical protein
VGHQPPQPMSPPPKSAPAPQPHNVIPTRDAAFAALPQSTPPSPPPLHLVVAQPSTLWHNNNNHSSTIRPRSPSPPRPTPPLGSADLGHPAWVSSNCRALEHHDGTGGESSRATGAFFTSPPRRTAEQLIPPAERRPRRSVAPPRRGALWHPSPAGGSRRFGVEMAQTDEAAAIPTLAGEIRAMNFSRRSLSPASRALVAHE